MNEMKQKAILVFKHTGSVERCSLWGDSSKLKERVDNLIFVKVHLSCIERVDVYIVPIGCNDIEHSLEHWSYCPSYY